MQRILIQIDPFEMRLRGLLHSQHLSRSWEAIINRQGNLHFRETTPDIVDGEEWPSNDQGSDRWVYNSYHCGGASCIEWVRYRVGEHATLEARIGAFYTACEQMLHEREYHALGTISNGWRKRAEYVNARLDLIGTRQEVAA